MGCVMDVFVTENEVPLFSTSLHDYQIHTFFIAFRLFPIHFLHRVNEKCNLLQNFDSVEEQFSSIIAVVIVTGRN